MESNPRIAIGIQSTVEPPERLSIQDWRLYLKVRSMQKMKMVRRLNTQLNRVLNQKFETQNDGKI